VKLLVDAQLPRALSVSLATHGHDSLHTLELPDGNRTPDAELCSLADREERILMTKDSDFVRSFHLADVPNKLLLVSTGNISNRRLLQIVEAVLPSLSEIFAAHRFVEMGARSLVVHM